MPGPAPGSSQAPAAAAAGRDFKETRLQIRLATGGQPLTTTLPSESSKSLRCVFFFY